MINIKVIGSSSKGNCYYITDCTTPLLLEVGMKFKDVQKALDFNTYDINTCLVTHEHGDHANYINEYLKRGINCFMSNGTAQALNIYDHHRVNTLVAKQPCQIGSWTVLPFDVNHDAAEPFGFLLANKQGERLLFATDTYYIRYKFPNLTHIMVECNYSKKILDENIESGRMAPFLAKRIMKSHFSLENVKEFFSQNDLTKLQEIWLLHLSDTNSNAEMFKREIVQLTGKMVFIA